MTTPGGRRYFFDGTSVDREGFQDANGNNIDDREDEARASGGGLRDRNSNRIDDRSEQLDGKYGQEYAEGLTVWEYGQKYGLDPRYVKYWPKGGGRLRGGDYQWNQTYEEKAARLGIADGEGGGGSDGPPDPVAAAAEQERRNAHASVKSLLGQYGLESLTDQAWTWLVEGLSETEIIHRIRETTEFKTRFPAIEERKKKGLPPISPGEYVAYERSARQMMRAAGMPEGFYDSPDDFQRFLNNDLSLSELSSRVTLAANAAFNMPKEDRDALTRWGMGPGDLTAFWLDPDKAQPLLERKYAAAQLAGAGSRTGWGNLDEAKATGLATQGVTADQAEQGFGALVESRELFQSLDRTEDVIGEDEQLGAVFSGNANAQRRIEQRRSKRRSQFQGGGSFAASQSGLVGLGDAADF